MIVRLRLFLSSYAPLFAIAAIRFDGVVLRLVLAGIAVVGVTTLAMLIWTSRHRISPRRVSPAAVEDMGSEVSAYVATYLLPFVAVDRPDALDLVAYGFAFLVLAVVFVNSNLIGVNPLLYLAGYRVFSVDGIRLDRTGTSRSSVMIAKDQPTPGQKVEIVDIANGVVMAFPPKKGTE